MSSFSRKSVGYFFDPLWIDEIVHLWQLYRTPILLVIVAILVISRIFLHLDEELDKLRAFPRACGTDDKKVGDNMTATTEEHATGTVERSESRSSDQQLSGPRRVKGEVIRRRVRSGSSEANINRKTQVLVFFSSLTRTTGTIARDFARDLERSQKSIGESTGKNFLPPKVLDLSQIDFDDYFLAPPASSIPNDEGVQLDFFYVFLIPSYDIDTINDTFLEQLKETHYDFRIDTAPLSRIAGYSVFGFGDRERWPTENEGFCFQAKELDKHMAKLTGRKRAAPLGTGDAKVDGPTRLGEWANGVLEALYIQATTGMLGEGVPGSGAAVESDDEEVDDEDGDDGEVLFEEPANGKPAQPKKNKQSGRIDDVEDLGRIMRDSQSEETITDKPRGAVPVAVDFTTYGRSPGTKATMAVKKMVPKNSPTYAALTKQGYSIVGSHSGVKICRWTKSALRGRGSCYKFSFYGINSHQCMETTPSLSCSNKCVFCWRHGTNPVGTTWRWVVDPPDLIFNGVKEGHYKKIKMLRGCAGVRAERYAEALRIRHCALSLVGEPIFYPHINEFLELLHAERISSFLVCNAQHPEQLAALKHVTQLYVSIDASNKESLRRIDRPLHRDFWGRFQRCLDILREKRFTQRTVFRLTLVKGFNIDDEAEGYADLVARGLPCFVEVKGVTYCGTSTSAGAGLTMGNVPFYHEVCDFVTALERLLNQRGLKYGIAAEHAHSCCILLASERFKVAGKWHSLIDYDKFFQLLEGRGPDGEFGPEDYMGPETPEWATWGSGGFDPRDQRVDKKGRPIVVS